MANPKKPPDDDPLTKLYDPLSKLMSQAGSEVDARLRDWIAKTAAAQREKANKGSTGSAGTAKIGAPQGLPPGKRPDGKDGKSRQADGNNTPPAGNVYEGGEEPPKKPDLKLGKWVLAFIFGVLPAIEFWKYVASRRWVGRTDYNGSAAERFLNSLPEVINGFIGEISMGSLFSSIVPLAIFIVGIIFVIKAIRVVPQQRAFVVERLGRFHATLEPGLRFTIPFVDRIAAKHDLREVPLDVPPQVCITKDNTQLQVDGILYFQVTDPKLATYGSSNFIIAITQLAQTTLRSIVGKLELDKTFEERDMINHAVVSALDDAAMNWGVKVLRYEIKDLTPPKEILHAMQAQITAEREKRALIAASEGRKQEQINIAMGQKEAAIAKSEGDKISDINQAQGEAAAILAKAEANAEAIRKIALAIESQGGLQAVNLKVAEQYVAAFGAIAKAGNTVVVPQNLTDIAGLVTAATSVLKAQK